MASACCGGQSPTRLPTLSEDRRRAHLAAYDLFEAVQGEAHAQAVAQVPAALAGAEEHDWPEVAFVVAAAGVVHAVTRPVSPEHRDAAVSGLVRRAEALDSPALLAIALGLRALTAAATADSPGLLADAARAVALLDDERQHPLDRCTAYVVVGAALNTLRLWELVDELFGEALALVPLCGAPAQTAAVAVNRVLLRLEWALALVETGDEAGAAERLALTAAAVPDALAAPLPELWRRDAEACADLVPLMGPTPSAEELATAEAHLPVLTAAGDVEVLPLLEAACALALLRRGDVAGAAAAAPALEQRSASSGARSFPLWVRAQVLAAAEPTAATAALQQHTALVDQLRWESRRVVLAAARTQIAVERRQADHTRLTRAVHTDALTGLDNRRSFDAWLERTPTEDDLPTALLLVDLDAFKQVNDTFGHVVGDDVLRRVGQLMRDSVRPGDLALRHGGDEFAVLLAAERLTADSALARAQELHAAIADAAWHELAPGLSISASVGLAVSTSAVKRDAASTYHAADGALYSAKRSGTGIVLAS